MQELKAELRVMPPPEEPEALLTPRSFRSAWRGAHVRVVVRHAINLPSGGWFGPRVDPYAVVRFRGGAVPRRGGILRTAVLKDAGSEALWNCEGRLQYGGERALEIRVLAYRKVSEDQVLAEGELQVSQLLSGRFEGLVNLEGAQGATRGRGGAPKQMAVVISVAFDCRCASSETPSETLGTSASHLTPV